MTTPHLAANELKRVAGFGAHLLSVCWSKCRLLRLVERDCLGDAVADRRARHFRVVDPQVTMRDISGDRQSRAAGRNRCAGSLAGDLGGEIRRWTAFRQDVVDLGTVGRAPHRGDE